MICISPVSWPIGAAPDRHTLMPLYWAGLWDAVNITPGLSSEPEAKYIMSVDARPMLATFRPCRLAPRVNASTSSGPDGRMSWAIISSVVSGSTDLMNSAKPTPSASQVEESI